MNEVPEPTLTPDQQIAGLCVLWALRDAMARLTGTRSQRSRARHARLQAYALLGEVSDSTMIRARAAYAAR